MDEALSVARQIEQDWEHDIAPARVAMHAFNQGNPQQAKEILSEMRDDEKRARGEFLIDWGLALQKLRQTETPQNLQQLIVDERGARVIRLNDDDFKQLVEVAQRFNLDFDDAYQYGAAEKHELLIVSFDRGCSNSCCS